MTGWLPAPAEELFGPDATAEESYEVLTVDVPPTAWISALTAARDTLGCTYFDWLSAVDEPGTGFLVSAHVAALGPVRRLLVRTTVPHDAPALPSAVGVYAGAAWHERETHEMFGVVFEDHPDLAPLLLPENFEGHPLRKDFVLAARVAKAWPGAKEPGESEHGGPKRRQMLPPGVPDPNEWGPLKGQLPPAPARPARGARPAGDRPVRRTRTAGEATPAAAAAAGAAGAEAGAAGAERPDRPERPARAGGPRRARSASEGSATQRATGAGAEPATGPAAAEPAAGAAAPAGPRRSRSASQGSASQRAASGAEPAAGSEPGAGSEPATGPEPGAASGPSTPARSSDAPWHHARPAFDDPAPTAKPEPAPEPEPEPSTGPATKPEATTDPEPGPEPSAQRKPEPEAAAKPVRTPEPESAAAKEPEPEATPEPEPDPAAQPEPEPETGGSENRPGGDTDRAPDDPAGGPQ
ncbi:NADH-quinone oxidoreductase subunit C [Streptomyces minutiscleroticus]|uniref:NADH-quinone oxidoreductase subunit C n=1 Tax=Streptomyces minutiscleroticus TaxID=68238 RepID=UPI003330E952